MLQQNALEKLAARDRWEDSESKIRSAADYLLRFKESGVASFKLRCAKGVKCKVNLNILQIFCTREDPKNERVQISTLGTQLFVR